MALLVPNVNDLSILLDTLVPPVLAMDGDPVGLQLGDPARPVRNILLALDASHSRVIEEAIEKKADLVISHHALIYRPLQKILTSDVYQKGIQRLIRHDVAVFAAHTNWDIVQGGVNDRLTQLLQLNEVSLLAETGQVDGQSYGIGRCGRLPKAVSLAELAQQLYRLLPTRIVRLVGNENQVVKRVAVLGGSGSHWLSAAIACGADVFITADVTYHDAQYAEEAGIGLLDPGHYAMEQPSLQALKEQVMLEADKRKWLVEVSISEATTDPFFLSIKK